ncbi:hypothetical protein P0W64_11490 [Tsukamurella sp. 8F]|uniref:hypothetical protein n=1 Tax=unclassified Tsukamurella TaxID=2633480 RepID=UPI0023B9BE07|nr:MULTISPECIES: hypothetical protein [unclassified Tsukamurella]MDF0529021.1 hypothetical protein [Tsukamurella sp. 8J]MDF0587394.1 hypothetical protein [Tsukamurella sp. 8F]
MTNPGSWQHGEQQWQTQYAQGPQYPHGNPYPQGPQYPPQGSLYPQAQPLPVVTTPPGRFGWARNQCTIVALVVALVYILLAETSHLVVIGIVPVVLAIRAIARREPLCLVAVVAAVAAVAISIHALIG